jgi:hypothetical protein
MVPQNIGRVSERIREMNKYFAVPRKKMQLSLETSREFVSGSRNYCSNLSLSPEVYYWARKAGVQFSPHSQIYADYKKNS